MMISKLACGLLSVEAREAALGDGMAYCGDASDLDEVTKMKQVRHFTTGTYLALLLLGFGWWPSPAVAFMYEIDTFLTGDIDPGDQTVAFVNVQQDGSDVDITITANLTSGVFDDAFFGSILLSWSGNGTLDGTSISCVSCNVDGITLSVDSFGNGGYNGEFDIEIDFQNTPPDYFDNSDVVTFTVLGAMESDFMGLAEGKNSKPDVYAFAHIQQVGEGWGGLCSVKYVGGGEAGANGGNSLDGIEGAEECVAVPEPSSVGLLGVALLALGGLAAWRRRAFTRIG